MNLTRYEQETHITFNAADDTAEVETRDPKYIRKLNKLCEEQKEAARQRFAKYREEKK